MRAIVCLRYGPPDVLQLAKLEKPVPADDELLIRVYASTVSAADYRIRGINVPTGFKLAMRLVMGMTKPRQPILGTELAGIVEAVGGDVDGFDPGDRVFALTGSQFGANAEYVCLSQDGAVASMPADATFEEAAALPFGGTTVLFFLRDRARVQRGQKVLVYGASGAVGTAAVQIARHLGAHVTGVSSTRNLELVRSLGADHVVDYTREDFAAGGEQYDVVIETVGKAPLAQCTAALKQDGLCIMVAGGVPDYLRALWSRLTGGKRIVGGVAPERASDLHVLRGLVETGALRPVIDRRYPLEETAEAHRYADTGRKRGSVVIVVRPEHRADGHRTTSDVASTPPTG